jgi:hypothetical protein
MKKIKGLSKLFTKIQEDEIVEFSSLSSLNENKIVELLLEINNDNNKYEIEEIIYPEFPFSGKIGLKNGFHLITEYYKETNFLIEVSLCYEKDGYISWLKHFKNEETLFAFMHYYVKEIMKNEMKLVLEENKKHFKLETNFYFKENKQINK